MFAMASMDARRRSFTPMGSQLELSLVAPGAVVSCPRLMTLCGAAMRRMTVRTFGRREILLHQRPAAAAAHDLLIVHAVAAADRLAGQVRNLLLGASPLVRAGRLMVPMGLVVRAGGPMMRRVMTAAGGLAAGTASVMLAEVHMPVTGTRPRHRRERRRLGCGRRRFGHRLLGRRRRFAWTGLLGRRRLLRRRLLRRHGRREHSPRKRCAKKAGTLHHPLHCSPTAEAG